MLEISGLKSVLASRSPLKGSSAKDAGFAVPLSLSPSLEGAMSKMSARTVDSN